MSQFAPGELVLLAQEKVPKEKCTRSPHRSKLQGRFAALPLRSSPSRGCAQRARSLTLTALRQGAHLYPGRVAVLGEGYGNGGGRIQYQSGGLTFNPLGAAEHRSKARVKLALCLSESSVASCASAGLYEKRREPALAGKPSGPPFFWVLFFGGQRKVPRPAGRNPRINEQRITHRNQIPDIKLHNLIIGGMLT